MLVGAVCSCSRRETSCSCSLKAVHAASGRTHTAWLFVQCGVWPCCTCIAAQAYLHRCTRAPANAFRHKHCCTRVPARALLHTRSWNVIERAHVHLLGCTHVHAVPPQTHTAKIDNRELLRIAHASTTPVSFIMCYVVFVCDVVVLRRLWSATSASRKCASRLPQLQPRPRP